MISRHPCFSKSACGSYGRMHLPVAPACNIQCGYCDRQFSCVNESRPGVTAKVLTPEEACMLAKKTLARMPNIAVAGIAGPGDPLANPQATLQTLDLLRENMPNLQLCLSTNGLALADHVEDLAELGVRFITITVNAVDPDIGSQIYLAVNSPGNRLTGRAGAEKMLAAQLAGLEKAAKLGMIVKINMVIVPGINDQHAAEVARQMAQLGAFIMNCIPMAPIKGTALASRGEPLSQHIRAIREKAEQWLPQMRHCGRCRADSVGLIGEKHIL